MSDTLLNNSNGQVTRRIVRLYREASDESLRYGVSWYWQAHGAAGILSRRFGVSREVATGVLAALSPSCHWSRNKSLAWEMLSTGNCGHMYGDAIRKARRIIDGEDPLDVLGGDKVRSFYRNILDPWGSDDVTVDRHAFDIAAGRVTDDLARKALETGGRKGNRDGQAGNYVRVADCYRRAADILGVSPHMVQAVTWCEWRDRKGIVD